MRGRRLQRPFDVLPDGADLFANSAVRRPLQVGVRILHYGRVVTEREVDIGENDVNEGIVRLQIPSLRGVFFRVRELPQTELCPGKLEIAAPGIIERDCLAGHRLGIREMRRVVEKLGEVGNRVGVFSGAELNGFTERLFSPYWIAAVTLRDALLGIRLVIRGVSANRGFKVPDRSSVTLLRIQQRNALFVGLASLPRHTQLMRGDRIARSCVPRLAAGSGAQD